MKSQNKRVQGQAGMIIDDACVVISKRAALHGGSPDTRRSLIRVGSQLSYVALALSRGIRLLVII